MRLKRFTSILLCVKVPPTNLICEQDNWMSEFGVNSVYEAFVRTTNKWPDNGFIAAPAYAGRDYHPAGIEYSYREVLAAADQLKTKYAAAGFGVGHRVAMLLEMRPEFFFHFLALNALGVCIVPINPDYRHDEMVYQMDHSDSDLIVTLGKRRDDLVKVARDCSMQPAVVSFEDFPNIPPSPGRRAPGASITTATENSLLYTSGTTGRPKGCILTNEYYLTSGSWYNSRGGMMAINEGQDRLYNPLPLFHMNCLCVAGMAMMLSGGCLIVPDRFHPSHWWQDVVSTKATIIHYLGVVVPMLLNQPDNDLERSHNIRFGVGGGVEPSLHGPFEDRFDFPLIELWGMTETGRVLTNHVEPRHIDTRAFGRSVDGFEAMVVDDEDNEVAVGTGGELVVRHSAEAPRKGLFSGYWKNSEATAEAWKNDWFHTGDTVRQAEDGMLYFMDRKKNIIRRSGENIAAAEIEACLQGHEKVAQVAVIAVPDEVREEEVMACVVAGEGIAAGENLAEELFEYSDQRLAYFKSPGWFIFVKSLPTTGTQKVQKQNIFPDGENPTKRPDAIDFRHRKKRIKG
jgi:crotonobetaine/carnitine-CoA ligase